MKLLQTTSAEVPFQVFPLFYSFFPLFSSQNTKSQVSGFWLENPCLVMEKIEGENTGGGKRKED